MPWPPSPSVEPAESRHGLRPPSLRVECPIVACELAAPGRVARARSGFNLACECVLGERSARNTRTGKRIGCFAGAAKLVQEHATKHERCEARAQVARLTATDH